MASCSPYYNPSRRSAVLLIPTLLLSFASFAATQRSSTAAGSDLLGPNVLRNADFSKGSAEWQLDVAKPAAASLAPGSGSLPAGVPGNALRVEIAATDNQKAHVQLSQRGLDLLEDEPYTLAFWARADRERTISLSANAASGDGHGIGLAEDAVRLTPLWHKFVYAFTACRLAKNGCSVSLLLGADSAPVTLAGVALRHGKLTAPSGTNLVRNGGFDIVLDPWSLETRAPAAGTVRPLPEDK